LEQRREKRDTLQKRRDTAESDRKDRVAKAVAAREQAQTFSQQREEKDTQLKALNARLEPLREKLASSKAAFDQAQQAAATATQDRATVQAWVKGLGGAVVKLGGIAAEVHAAAQERSAWDASVLVAARAAAHDAGAH